MVTTVQGGLIQAFKTEKKNGNIKPLYSNTYKIIKLNGIAHSLHALFTKFVWSIWLDIGQGLFLCVFTDRDKVDFERNAKQG